VIHAWDAPLNLIVRGFAFYYTYIHYFQQNTHIYLYETKFLLSHSLELFGKEKIETAHFKTWNAEMSLLIKQFADFLIKLDRIT